VNLFWTDRGWDDYLYWQANDPKLVEKINALLKDLRRTPFQGLGKPEPLRGSLTGWWSRRITGDHRLVYRVRGKGADQCVEIVACRFHY
jgi:toxin YoeB